MPVLIASVEDPSMDIRLEGALPDHDGSTHEFKLNRPIGDDWLQYIRHVPNPPPLLVRIDGATAFVVFDKVHEAEAFRDWLQQAREEQEHGFRTMRG